MNNESLNAVPRMMTVREISEETKISEYTIRRLIKNNQIIYFKSGSKFLINFDRFLDFLNGREQ